MSSKVSPIKKETRAKSTRKKTARACNHCHKAHMTCDETRPCKRCVTRGLGETCVDAPRKKKKYLMDVPDGLENVPMTRNNSLGPISTTSIPDADRSTTSPHLTANLNDLYPPVPSQGSGHITSSSSLSHQHQHQPIPSTYDLNSTQFALPEVQPPPQEQQQSQSEITTNVTRKSRSKFMSNAANSEYSILSHIISQDEFGVGMKLSPSQSYSETTMSPPTIGDNGGGNHIISRLRQSSTNSHSSRNSSPTPTSSFQTSHDIYNTFNQGDKSINQYMLGFIQDQMVTYPEVMKSIQGDASLQMDSKKKAETRTLSFSIAVNDSPESTPSSNSTQGHDWGLRFKEAEDIYAKIDKPFPYTPGFHSLIHYLRSRFNRSDLIQMAKSMASYRPSFIACTNTLKEDDLIFMEQCFQRTLLEYDKFISLSGTPTIVWRRTGQISYVSEEFTILTGWTKEHLLNKVTFIVEIMDDSSVIEYFDLFSTIAYGDFKAATMGGCTLLTPDNSTIRTTCIWTLKRDVFGIPMMIIGNFLPII